MVTFAGTVALASSAGVKAATASLSPTEIVADRRRLRAVVAGRTFELDTQLFGGSPHLVVTRTASAVTAALKSATYPGTDIPADLDLHFESLGGSTRLRIRSSSGGFDATVPLLAWLEGRATARSRLNLARAKSELSDGRMLRFRGSAQATLHPDLTLDLLGTDIVSLTGSGVSLVGSEAHIWLASASAPTLFTHRIKRRTFIQIRGKNHEWNVSGVTTPAGSSVAFDPDSFDQATIEAAQTLAGRRLAIVSFENSHETGAALLKLASGASGGPAMLPLRNPRYAFVCGDHDRFSLSADVADATSWLEQPGHSLLLGRDTDSPEVVMQGWGGTAEQVEGKVEVLGVAVPIEGVIASPLMFPSAHAPATDQSVSLSGGTETDTLAPQTLSLEAGLLSWLAPLPIYFALDAASITLTRPEDMLTVKLEFYNLRLLVDLEVPTLFRRVAANPSYLVVELPPQALLEQAYYAETGTASAAMSSFLNLLWLINPKTPPIQARIAEPTRLAFRIPDSVLSEGIPYTLEGLLNWTRYSNSVAPWAQETPQQVAPGSGSFGALVASNARPPKHGTHFPLVAPETSIEAPWGLYLSPSDNREYWSHRIDPLERDGVTELWHTTLTGRRRWQAWGWGTYQPGVRAVWARHYSTSSGRLNDVPDLFRNSFTTDVDDQAGYVNRWALVDITARYGHPRVTAERLTLTSLGAWLDLRGQWPVTDYAAAGEYIATALEAWTHRATMGRDQFVRIVKAGRLFPFGNRASHVTITERKFQEAPDGKRTAYLIQRSFIIVREPDKSYSLSDTGQGPVYRAFPFKRVTFKTRVTPDLANPSTNRVYTADKSWWPRLLSTGGDFLFEYAATDWDGRTTDLRSPLIFVPEEYATKWPGINPADAAAEIDACDAAMLQVQIAVNGQKVAYSEPLPASATEDRRVLETQIIRFGALSAVMTSWAAAYGKIYFYPRLHRANVRLEDVEALMNAESGTWIRLWGGYLGNGYTGINAEGRVFAEISDSGAFGDSGDDSASSLALNISPERAGGFATPNLSVTGLSATGGAFGGTPENYGSGSLKADDFFANANPTLFGDITLLDILSLASGQGISLGPKDVPLFNDYIVKRDGETLARYEYSWNTEKFGNKSAIFKPSSSPKTRLELLAFLEKNLSRIDAPPSSGVNGSLVNFTLSLFDIIDVEFTSFGFSIDTGGDVDVTPKIKDIRFSGALEFVNQLREIMNFTGDDGGFAIDINAEGLSAIVTIALPDVAVGVFSLKNMSISAGFILPFTGEPLRFPFSFCKPESPFELAVSGFGGGGYFIVELQASDTNAIALLELSLEFGVCASVTLAGIASGSVEIKGGVTLRIAGEELSFTAFFRMSGRLDILGIIKVSVLFSLTLTYMNKSAALSAGEGNGQNAILIGEASLSIDIEILFFSFSVTLTVKKKFDGDDPRFGDWMLEDEWATYCEAFGPATVGA
ncbi:MAG: hypothetical protein K0B85_02720 [Coriobacteriia bacterium]|nr:hypothetical protein [Coriobacteriia bacterium]